jgi:hypothetical protein
MVTVPSYQRTETDRPIFQQGVTTRATPDDMGAAIGRGLADGANALGQASDAMAAVRDLEDMSVAKEAEARFAAWEREARAGPEGYLSLSGRAAVDAREAFERELSKQRMAFGSALKSPGARRMYTEATERRIVQTLEAIVGHQASERKRMVVEASDSRARMFADDAVADFNLPERVNASIEAGIKELRQQGSLLGWDPDTMRAREIEYTSTAHRNVALRMAQDDALAAQAYLDKHREVLTGADQFALEEALDAPVAVEASKKETARIIAQIQTGEIVDFEQELAAIEDDDVRNLTRKAITGALEAQAKADRANKDAATEAAFGLIEKDGISPFQLPADITTKIGREGMSQLMEYWNKRQKGEAIYTDDNLLYQLQDLYATAPQQFAQVDILPFRSRLSDEDWNMVNGWRRQSIEEPRKARESGKIITDAFKQAEGALASVGMSVTNLKGGHRDAMEAKVSQFQNALARLISEHVEQNDGQNPTYQETQEMIDRLLLPVVFDFKDPIGAALGFDPNVRGIDRLGKMVETVGLLPAMMLGQTRRRGMLFEAPTRALNENVAVAVRYEDIPIDIRNAIEADIERATGRPNNSQNAVIDVYERFMLGEELDLNALAD